jgi:hypothetical protein
VQKEESEATKWFKIYLQRFKKEKEFINLIIKIIEMLAVNLHESKQMSI